MSTTPPPDGASGPDTPDGIQPRPTTSQPSMEYLTSAGPPIGAVSPGESASQPPLTAGYTPPGTGWTVTITPRTIWLTVGIVLLTVGLVILLFQAIYVWILLFIAIVIAEGLRPIVRWMHRRLHIPRPAAIFALLIVVIALALALIYFFISPFTQQISQLTTNFPSIQAAVQNYIEELSNLIGNSTAAQTVVNTLQSQAGTILSAIGPLLLQIPLLIGQFVLSAVIVVVMVFFWLTGIDRLEPFVSSLLPESAQPRIRSMVSLMSVRVGGYLRGVVVNMFVIGVLSGGGDWLLGAPYPLILGLVAGIFEILPYIGPWISGAIAILFAFVFADPLKALEIIVFYIVIQEFEGNTLVPVVMMRAVKLNPLVVLIGVIAGGELLGIIGSILAVPFVAIIQVLITEALVPAARHASARINEHDLARRVGTGGVGGGPPNPGPALPTPTQPA